MQTYTRSYATADEGPRSIEEKEIEKETIVCPQMVFGGKLVNKATMREEECLGRLKNNNECLRYCTAVDHLRKRHKLPAATIKSKTKTPSTPSYKPKVMLICACGEEFATQSDDRNECMPCLIKRKMAVCRSPKKYEHYKVQLERAIETIRKNKEEKKVKW